MLVTPNTPAAQPPAWCYGSHKTPPGYVCGGCRKAGVRLWRRYQDFEIYLRCVACAEAEEGRPCVLGSALHGGSDQIGSFVPAVPDEDGTGFWGYTSVPEAGCEWWGSLPLVVPSTKEDNFDGRNPTTGGGSAAC